MGKLEIGAVAAVLFAASSARVIETLWHHSRFDRTATLALLLVVALPWFFVHSRRPSRSSKAGSIAADVHD